MGRKTTIRIEGKTIREISAETGIREATLRARIFRGCTIKDIVAKRPNTDAILIGGMTLAEISAVTGISKNTLYWRYKHGRTDFDALTGERYGVRMPHNTDKERK